jgi:hypothetical protein
MRIATQYVELAKAHWVPPDNAKQKAAAQAAE